MKAAVRYFYKDAQEDTRFRVDTQFIFIGGYSAGAITSLHYGYANTSSDISEIGGEYLFNYVANNGGLEGLSGNSGYSE